MAGFKTNEIIEAMPGLLDLAAAAGSDLGVTSDIVSDAITAFGLKAKDTTHLADIMAKASSTANTNVEMLGESFKYAAAPATAFGMSAEETTAALAMMANAGIKSSMAGTALRGALTRLSKPPKEAAEWLDRLGVSISDNHGKIRPFNAIMGDMRNKISKLTQAEKQQAIASIFGQEAMSGMLAVLNTSTKDFENYTQNLKNADGTAKEMAKMKLDTLQGQFTILKSAVEGMNIELGERLAPYAKKFVTWFTGKIPDITNKIVEIVDKVSDLAHKFNALSPATKKFIGYLALGTIIIGPLVKGINGLASGISLLTGLGTSVGSFLGVFKGASTVAKTTTAVAKSTGLASKGIGLFGLSAKAGTALLNPWVLGIVGAGVTVYGLHKHLKKQVIPSVDLFTDKIQYSSKKIVNASGDVEYEMNKTTHKISEGTKKAVNAYMEMDKKIGNKLTNLYVKGAKITKATKDDLVGSYVEMGKEIRKGIDKQYHERVSLMQDLFSKSKGISKAEQEETLKSMQSSNQTKKREIDNYVNSAAKILQDASQNSGKISAEQQSKLDSILSNMRGKAITHLSETEMDSKILLERIKSFSERVTAEQASNMIQEAEKTRIKTIDEANKKYLETKAAIEYERDITKQISPQTAQILIDEAERQRKESIDKAENMKEEVVKQLKLMNEDVVKKIDTGDGHIKEKHEQLIEWIKTRPITRIVRTIQENDFKLHGDEEVTVDGISGASPSEIPKKKGGKALGSSYVLPGAYEVAEHGFEIVVGRQTRLFKGGEKVLNHRESKKLFNSESTKESKPTFMVAQPQLAGSGGNNIKVNVDMKNNFNNDDDVETIVQEAMQEFGYKLKEALKNTKK